MCKREMIIDSISKISNRMSKVTNDKLYFSLQRQREFFEKELSK